MPLTNPVWGTPIDPGIAQASTDTTPLAVGSSGPSVTVLKKALAQVGFERGLDRFDFYGPHTALIVTDFQDLYILPKSGIAGKSTLETIDKVLNRVYVPKNNARAAEDPFKVIGGDFARKHIAKTKQWIQKAIDACDQAYKEFWMGNDVDEATALALLFHFRIVTTGLASVYSTSLGYDARNVSWKFLDGLKTENRYKVVERIQRIKGYYRDMLANLNQHNGDNFETYYPPEGKADPKATSLAWADVDAQKVYFHGSLFYSRSPSSSGGKDVKSASWTVIHELGHLILGHDSFHTYITVDDQHVPVNNSYSSNMQYYADSADQCFKNPDSYSHFAYQIFFGRENVGPY